MSQRTIRQRLGDLLKEAGHPLVRLPHSSQGNDRINRRFDDTTMCWDGWTSAEISLHVVSYDTMTACVKHGILLRPGGYLLWVAANTPPIKAPS